MLQAHDEVTPGRSSRSTALPAVALRLHKATWEPVAGPRPRLAARYWGADTSHRVCEPSATQVRGIGQSGREELY